VQTPHVHNKLSQIKAYCAKPARRLGYRVQEVPVVWRHSPQSRMRVGRDATSMLGEVLWIWWQARRVRAPVPPLDRLTGPGGASQ
jgi:hypothetical protein